MGITGRKSGSPDGTFPLEKVTFLKWARCGHEKMKEGMKKVNGKPYLRTKIALRVIVWWPFCDFFKKNLIPALVKVTIGQCGTRKRYRRLFNRCHFFQGKSIHFEMRAATNKFSDEEDVLGIVRLT